MVRSAVSMRSLQSAVVPRAAVEAGSTDRGKSTLSLIRCPLLSYTSPPGWQTTSSLEGEPHTRIDFLTSGSYHNTSSAEWSLHAHPAPSQSGRDIMALQEL